MLAAMAMNLWIPRAGWVWDLAFEGLVVLWLLAATITSFVRVSDEGIVSYQGMGKLESAWDNVEGVHQIEVGGRSIRCIVLRTPGRESGWYWAGGGRSLPREYRGRVIEIPESGPASYHDGERLVVEIQRHPSTPG